MLSPFFQASSLILNLGHRGCTYSENTWKSFKFKFLSNILLNLSNQLNFYIYLLFTSFDQFCLGRNQGIDILCELRSEGGIIYIFIKKMKIYFSGKFYVI